LAKHEATGHKFDEFASDLGKLLGTAQTKAEGWLSQRAHIVKQLTAVRDTASKLLRDLGHEAAHIARRGRPAGKRGPGRPQREAKPRRKLSARARKAISDAQKKRWAAHRAAAK
jgi:hypothetical protein